jgi:hypothetical protein
MFSPPACFAGGFATDKERPSFERYSPALSLVYGSAGSYFILFSCLIQTDTPFPPTPRAPGEIGESNGRTIPLVDAAGTWMAAPQKVAVGTTAFGADLSGLSSRPRPRSHMFDVPIKDIVDLVLRVDVGAYSFEAANPRHEHEWKVWKDVTLPAGKVLMPGLIAAYLTCRGGPMA